MKLKVGMDDESVTSLLKLLLLEQRKLTLA